MWSLMQQKHHDQFCCNRPALTWHDRAHSLANANTRCHRTTEQVVCSTQRRTQRGNDQMEKKNRNVSHANFLFWEINRSCETPGMEMLVDKTLRLKYLNNNCLPTFMSHDNRSSVHHFHPGWFNFNIYWRDFNVQIFVFPKCSRWGEIRLTLVIL